MDGSLFCWGKNETGQLGMENECIPKKVNGIPGKICQIKCGNAYSMAITSNHQIYIWGSNTCGQLGNGNKNKNETIPVKMKCFENEKVFFVKKELNKQIELESGVSKNIGSTPILNEEIKKPIIKWSTLELFEYLSKHEILSPFAKIMKEESINGEVLIALTIDEVKSLGLKLGHFKMLQTIIKQNQTSEIETKGTKDELILKVIDLQEQQKDEFQSLKKMNAVILERNEKLETVMKGCLLKIEQLENLLNESQHQKELNASRMNWKKINNFI
eukprot:TRINITY_DN9613_c2_g2_i4.p1 TRINITY_DN9613_c2_g2~~TRINITY_DN9613_c2_g2_i4.p1  ORF type:complete len:293 (-),score=82.02 TRINITY_DN9613_c2_g2_i4:321-1139(-)